MLNGQTLQPSTFAGADAALPFMPNVLKVFLENGQTKSFKYDASTTVRDVVTSLQQKLCIKAADHFALTVEHVKSLRRNKLTLLDPDEPLSKVSCQGTVKRRHCRLWRGVEAAASRCSRRTLDGPVTSRGNGQLELERAVRSGYAAGRK